MGKLLTVAAILGGLLMVAVPVLLSEVIGGWVRKYTSSIKFRATDIPDLSGKVAIVTGSNTGIGYVTALELARNGANVVVAARNQSRGQAAVENMIETLGDNANMIRFLQLDLGSLTSVKRFVQEFEKLDLPLHLLVNNAGIMKSPGVQFVGQNFTYGYELTEDGFESHIGVNHIGHAYLTHLLTEKLKKSAPSRVIQVSSMAEEGAYAEGIRFDLWKPAKNVEQPHPDYEDGLAYGQSKLANLLFTKEFAQRMNGTGVSAYSCHPGVISSELSRYMEVEINKQSQDSSMAAKIFNAVIYGIFGFALFSVEDGALTQLHLATAPTDSLINGGFYHPIARLHESGHPEGKSVSLRKSLWEETVKALQIEGNLTNQIIA